MWLKKLFGKGDLKMVSHRPKLCKNCYLESDKSKFCNRPNGKGGITKHKINKKKKETECSFFRSKEQAEKAIKSKEDRRKAFKAKRKALKAAGKI